MKESFVKDPNGIVINTDEQEYKNFLLKREQVKKQNLMFDAIAEIKDDLKFIKTIISEIKNRL